MSLGGGSLKAPSSVSDMFVSPRPVHLSHLRPGKSTHSMYINSGQALGQCFSKDPPSQSSSLDSLASFYSGAATPEKRYTVKNAKLLKTTKSDMHFSKPDSDDLDVPLPGSISITTSNPDLCAYNDNMHTTLLTLVWERPEKRRGGPSGHNRSHSLASSPSGALGRRETSRRHAIYCGPGVSDISIPYDDPEETRVNPSRSTIASFDSNKAVFEDSFSDSPKKRKDSLLAGFAPASPVKPLSNTPEHVLRFFNITTGVSDTRYYDTSITAVTSSSSDEEMRLHLGPSKENVSIVLPLKIQSATKRNSVGGVKRVTNPEDISTTVDSDALEHLPLMHELLDLVEEATKSWQLLWL